MRRNRPSSSETASCPLSAALISASSVANAGSTWPGDAGVAGTAGEAEAAVELGEDAGVAVVAGAGAASG